MSLGVSEVRKEDEIGDGFYGEGWVPAAGEEVVDWKGRFPAAGVAAFTAVRGERLKSTLI